MPGILQSLSMVNASSAAYPGFSYDLTQGFEAALSGDWSETDTGAFVNAQDAAAEKVGTYGMSIATGSTAEDFVLWNAAGANYAAVTIVFWYKTGAYAGFAGDKWICNFRNDGSGSMMSLREGRSAGDNSRRFSWNLDSDVVTVSDNTAYWIKARFTNNGTCEAAVYTEAGAQVGSTMTATGGAANINDIWFGSYGVSSSTSVYFDEIYINHTTNTGALLPVPA